MICPRCNFKFKDPGKVKGGQASRRTLTADQARSMVKAREEKRRAANAREDRKRKGRGK